MGSQGVAELVSALVAIDSFSENITRSIHEQSRALVGGDLSLSS